MRSDGALRVTLARPGYAIAVALLLALALPHAARAQDESTEARLRAERQKLERLKQEREELERQRVSLRNRVHDLSEEVENLDREADMTERVVRSLDAQLAAINSEVESTTADLIRAQDEITLKRAVLRQRLVDIYKRGPLYSVEVLLSATSFGDLLARYKYLHLIALRDRALVKRVEDLSAQIKKQRANLVRFQADIQLNLQEKADEERRLRDLHDEQARSLARAKRSAQETERRLAQLSHDEQRLADVIASLEEARRRAERATPRASRAASTLGRGGAGARLDWPVDGPLIYNFGRVVNPNNTTIRWNGIGIKAPAGTPVHAVAAGKVLVAEPFGTYGLTVIIQHPGGDYSVYGSLGKIATQKGAVVSKGEVIGYVGSSDPEMGPHLHFELRPEGRAVDPLDYLRPNP
ncbi:MAG: peptidoglycan DD-metalloendopeptidase family protein [Gemmatimonadaceae bacterium]|nr:peptidoglycan DD-metalloendopeptidase family protein [Gemmatimonadaceae bacterium]